MTQLIRNTCAAAPLPASLADRIELIPVGRFKTADARPAFHITDASAVIAASLAAAPGGMLPIDFDHRTFAGQGRADSRAAGWITALAVEGDRIMASVDWTPEGRKALEDRSYRFVSPVFKNRKSGEVVLIEGAGLVNSPALPQLRQLASKDEDMDPILQIAGLLGLSADTPDAIVARVTALAATEAQLASITQAAGVSGADAATQICARLTAKAPDPARFVPMAAFEALQTQMAALQEDMGKSKVDAALEAAREAGKLTPDLEDWACQLASRDLGAFEGWAKVAPVRVNLGDRQLAGKRPPVKTADDGLDALERQVAARMGVSEAAFIAARTALAQEA